MKRILLIIPFFLVAFALQGKKNVAISYFDNNAKDPEFDPLSKGIADMMITELSDAQGIRVIERERLEELLDELELNKSEYIDPETAQKLGKGLGAEAILTGAFTVQGDRMRIDARLLKVETAEVLLTEKVSGPKDDFFDLHDQLAQKLLKTLNSASDPNLSKENENVAFRSVVDYSRAIDQKDNGLGERAKATLQNTLERTPGFDIAKSKLDSVEVWLSKLEKERKARLEEDLRSTLEDFDPKADGLGQKLNRIWTRLLSSQEYSKMLEFNKMLRKKGMEPDQKLHKGSDRTFERTAGHYDLLALYHLKRYKEFLPKARNYLEKYPESPQFQGIETQVRQAAEELEKRKKGEKQAEEAIAELDTSEYSRKELLEEHATIYQEEARYAEAIAVRWRLLENFSMKEEAEARHYFFLAQAYQELGAFEECRRIGDIMERKFPENDYTEGLTDIIRHLPK